MVPSQMCQLPSVGTDIPPDAMATVWMVLFSLKYMKNMDSLAKRHFSTLCQFISDELGKSEMFLDVVD